MHDEETTHGRTEPIGTVRVAASADTLRITLTGEVDAGLSQELDDAARVVQQHGLPVMVDALGVTFMDSNGARFLSRCYLHGPLTVVGSPPVRFLLRVLAMDEVLADPA